MLMVVGFLFFFTETSGIALPLFHLNGFLFGRISMSPFSMMPGYGKNLEVVKLDFFFVCFLIDFVRRRGGGSPGGA